MIQRAGGGSEMGVAASFGEGDVEGGVLGEPFVGTGFDPEGDDFGGGKQLDHATKLVAHACKCTFPEGGNHLAM
ncbi:hypothetical protein D3C85_1731500 [compost metagenome]